MTGVQTCALPISVWISKDFVNWSFSGTYFPSAKDQLYWAPSTVKKANGKYYIYPTINTSIYVGVADSPAGPFRIANGPDSFSGSDKAKPLLEAKGPKGTKGIDAEVYIDDDGKAYMFWAQRGAARLMDDMVTLDTHIVVIPTKRQGYSEGPFMFKRKGIYYYTYTLDGHETYKNAYIFSRVSPLGPFEFPENDIFISTDKHKGIYGPGHGSVFSVEGTDDYYFAYLEFGRGGPTRQVWVDKLEFNEDGTIKPVELTHEGPGALHTPENKGINIAGRAKVTASSTLPDLKVKPIFDPEISRTETFLPSNAIDVSNGTRWMAAESDSAAWFIADFGKKTKVFRTEAFFCRPTSGYAYVLEYSNDGKSWTSCGGHNKLTFQSPHADVINKKTRFLRYTFLSGEPGIWEFKVFKTKK